MLELTYLILAKDSDILALQNENVAGTLFEHPDSDSSEFQIQVESDTVEILIDYITATQHKEIIDNDVALIRFYT